MILKVTHVIVNTEDNETEYKMDRPDWELNRMLHELSNRHPSLTSIVVTLVRNERL